MRKEDTINNSGITDMLMAAATAITTAVTGWLLNSQISDEEETKLNNTHIKNIEEEEEEYVIINFPQPEQQAPLTNQKPSLTSKRRIDEQLEQERNRKEILTKKQTMPKIEKHETTQLAQPTFLKSFIEAVTGTESNNTRSPKSKLSND